MHSQFSCLHHPFPIGLSIFEKKNISGANCTPFFQVYTPSVIGLSIFALHPFFLLSCTPNVT